MASMNVRLKPLNDQEELVFRLHREEKLSDVEVAQRLGRSLKRTREIYAQALERMEDFARHGDESLLLLPLRARKFVREFRLGDRAWFRNAIETGGLWWDKKRRRICWEHRPLYLSNVNWATWVVLNEWARLPAPVPKKTKKCPHCGKDIGV